MFKISSPLSYLSTITLLFFILLNAANAGAKKSLEEKVSAALKEEYRTEADRARDKNRAPVKALSFFGLQDDMKVIEFGPGGTAWYTKILAPVLKDKGQLYVAFDGDFLDRVLDPLMVHDGMSKIKKLPIPVKFNRKRMAYDVGKLNFGMKDADMFLSIRLYHAFTDEDAIRFHKAVYKSLKPGGRYIIVDHTRRHMEPNSSENRRRRDPVKVIKHLLDEGFEFVDYTDMFFRPDDELRYEVGRKTVTGNTDRFTFIFEKPKK